MESWMVILQQNIVSCWSRSPPQCRTIPFTSSFTTQPTGPQVGMKKMEDGVLLLNRYFNYSFAALPVVHPALPVEVCSSTPMDAPLPYKVPNPLCTISPSTYTNKTHRPHVHPHWSLDVYPDFSFLTALKIPWVSFPSQFYKQQIHLYCRSQQPQPLALLLSVVHSLVRSILSFLLDMNDLPLATWTQVLWHPTTQSVW